MFRPVGSRANFPQMAEHEAFMQQQIPNAKIVAIQDIGACPVLLKPDRCAEEILEFLMGACKTP